MITPFTMIELMTSDIGIFRYDGNSIVGDVTESSLVSGTYIKDVVFYDYTGSLKVYLSDGSNILINNFLTLSGVSVEAIAKKGFVGTAGADGKPGLDGKLGLDGAAGDQGLDGDIGPIGDRGYQGDYGNEGNVGDNGSMGQAGLDGNAGLQGSVGRPGVMGNTGNGGYSNVVYSYTQPNLSILTLPTNSIPIWISIGDNSTTTTTSVPSTSTTTTTNTQSDWYTYFNSLI